MSNLDKKIEDLNALVKHLQKDLNEIKSSGFKLDLGKVHVESRTPSERGTCVCQSLMKWIAENFTGLFAVVSGIVGLFIAVGNYMDQQEQKLKFQVTREVIQLVEKLGDDPQDDNRGAKKNYALLMASYGKHAVPILLNVMESTSIDDTTLLPGITEALFAISNEVPNAVSIPLMSRSQSYLKDVLTGDENRVDALINTIKTMAKFGSSRQAGELIIELEQFQTDLGCPDKRDEPYQKVKKVDQKSICNEIQKTLKNLRS